MTEKDKTGKELERRVADAYREMGARKVEHDVELAGNQIDVYVELGTTADHSLHRIAVEVKDRAKPAGIEIVGKFAAVVDGLRRLKLVDEGVIVSASGFTRPGHNRAKEEGLRLLEPADLDAMVAALALKDAFERLNEWKELHNLLQGLLISFGPFHRQVDLAYASGVLDLPSLRTSCHPVDIQIDKLTRFASKINYIGRRYKEARDDLHGELWVVDIVVGQRRIKAALKEAALEGRGDSHVLLRYCQMLSDLANELDSKCNSHLDFADGELHQTAIQATRNLRDWQKGLANEHKP